MESNSNSIFLSVVSPVYLAESIIPFLVKNLKEVIKPITENFEIILVEDGSPDMSWRSIQAECVIDNRVKGVKLSRNFGQHRAISAGLAASKGNFVIVMDCDLQDNPSYIPTLLNKAKEGYDIIYTVKIERKHGLVKNFLTKSFNRIFNYLIENKSLHSNGLIGAYSLITRKVVNEFLKYGDYKRHYLMILRWLGFSCTYVTIQHEERFSGKSSYNLSKLVSHAIDGITSQSDKVLLLTVYGGFFLAFSSIIAALLIIVLYFVHGFQSGWASLAVLTLFSCGTIVTTIGIVGVYVGKTFEQVKGRQLFIIDKSINI